jgi:hypothetical protein
MGVSLPGPESLGQEKNKKINNNEKGSDFPEPLNFEVERIETS